MSCFPGSNDRLSAIIMCAMVKIGTILPAFRQNTTCREADVGKNLRVGMAVGEQSSGEEPLEIYRNEVW